MQQNSVGLRLDSAVGTSVHGVWRKEPDFMDADVRAEIEALKGATVRELKTRYRELFGEVSPSSNHAHLWRRIAWRLQARRQGALSDRARSRALELASDTDLRVRAPHAFW